MNVLYVIVILMIFLFILCLFLFAQYDIGEILFIYLIYFSYVDRTQFRALAKLSKPSTENMTFISLLSVFFY